MNFLIGIFWLGEASRFAKFTEREISVASFFELADNFPNGKQGQ